MKFITTLLLLFWTGMVRPFAPLPPTRTRLEAPQTSLDLFGGGGKSTGEQGKGAGMFDQMTMLMKAQEFAKLQKAQKAELESMSFTGTAADGKVTASLKLLGDEQQFGALITYTAIFESFDFDDAWYEEASTEAISNAVVEAYRSGLDVVTEYMKEKSKDMEEKLDLKK